MNVFNGDEPPGKPWVKALERIACAVMVFLASVSVGILVAVMWKGR